MIFEEERDYVAVLASQAKASLGPKGSLPGDILTHLVIVPASTSPGKVSIFDGASGTEINVFPGGATSVASLAPIFVKLRARSIAGGWKIQTGAGVSVIAVGRFQ